MLHPAVCEKVDGEDYVRQQYNATISSSDIMPQTPPLERRMKEMVNLNFRWFMQTLLDRKDRMSMYHGLEVRVPFCDYRIAEYLYRVPWAYKDHNGMEKGLLRHAVRGLLPDEVLHRKKSPYPKTHHPEYESMVRAELERLLKEKDAPVFQLVDRNSVVEMMEGESKWPWYGQLMTRPQTMAYLLQIDFWMEHYGVKMV